MASYTVRKGDCLSEIGQALKIDWREIASLNGLHSPYTIFPGQVLKLPQAQAKEVKTGMMDLSPFIAGAQAGQAKTGFPASVTLAQIVLESSGKYPGGVSGLAYEAKNLFGIKGVGPAGSYTIATKEVIGGRTITVNAAFRKYNNYSESIEDHLKLLSGSRYANQFKSAKSVNDYCNGLQKAGYATDPSYANKLINIITMYNLHQYDGGNFHFHP